MTAATHVGPYALEGVLGEGAMGVVYRQRCLREARVAAEVEHPHLVSIIEAGKDDGRPYLAARYIAGRSLKERIAGAGPLPVAEVLAVTAQVGAGLDALHAAGLVHRDVKPSNVMLDEDGTALLCDYALGCVAYECLAGSPPFGGLNAYQVGVAHLEEEPPDPCAGRTDVPSSLSWAVLRALEKDPARRPNTGTAYAHLLALAAR